MPRKIIRAFEVSLTTHDQKTHYFLNVLVAFVPGTGGLGHAPYRNSVRNVISPPEIVACTKEIVLEMVSSLASSEREKSLFTGLVHAEGDYSKPPTSGDKPHVGIAEVTLYKTHPISIIDDTNGCSLWLVWESQFRFSKQPVARTDYCSDQSGHGSGFGV